MLYSWFTRQVVESGKFWGRYMCLAHTSKEVR